ncbi:MAG: thymidylate synthase (FAD), partial [Cyanobacteria bacterium WB6_1B_304]|nr:thymidylate synthase (FAD) [Cyanobacteria bacterium WB6_1B_304]
SLQSVLHFIGLRRGVGAQTEIGLYAQGITGLIQPIVPVAMEAWEAYQTLGST